MIDVEPDTLVPVTRYVAAWCYSAGLPVKKLVAEDGYDADEPAADRNGATDVPAYPQGTAQMQREARAKANIDTPVWSVPAWAALVVGIVKLYEGSKQAPSMRATVEAILKSMKDDTAYKAAWMVVCDASLKDHAASGETVVGPASLWVHWHWDDKLEASLACDFLVARWPHFVTKGYRKHKRRAQG